MPISRRPVPLAQFFKSTSGLNVGLSLDQNENSIAAIKGTPGKEVLVFAPKSGSFSGFRTDRDYLTVKIKAIQPGNGSYHAAAPIERIIKIKKPTKNAFFEERRMDSRYSQIKQKFKNRFSGVSSEKADYMFDSDNYDSDGDGLSNIEREPSEVILSLMIIDQ